MAPPTKRRPGHSRRAQYSLFVAYVLAIGGATLGLVLVLLSAFDPPAFAALRSAVSEIVSPVSSGADLTRRGIGAIPRAIGDYVEAGTQNSELRARVIAQQRQVRQARGLAYENARLRRLVRLQEGATQTVVTARLVSSTGTSTRRFATLNAGRRHGVLPGQPVRGPDGLVGRVIETGINVSRVMLATDPESVIPVRRARDGLPGFAYGHGDGLVEIRGVSTGINAFRVGDRFFTSGAGGVFPPGTPVAQVTRPQGDSALARPFADPDRLDFAIVQPVFLPPPPALPELRPMRRPVAATIAMNATPGRSLWIPAVSIMLGSCVTIIPHVFSAPLMPPFGLLILLGWRLLRPELFRIWAPVPLGLFDDLLSGQPLGSAMLLWTLCFLAVDVIDRRMFWRDFRQDWLIACGLIAGAIAGGVIVAWPRGPAPPFAALGVQMIMSTALFPFVTRLVARLDSWRS